MLFYVLGVCVQVMDAVELPLPVAVRASKLMGPDGFVRAGVTGKGVEACDSDRVSVLVSPAFERCSPLRSQKDGMDMVADSESAPWNKIQDSELCMHGSQKPSFQHKYASERLSRERTNGSLLLFSSPEVKELPWKAGKLSRSSSGCAKKMRVTQMKDSLNVVKDNKLNKLGLSTANSTFTEKTPVVKQKNSLNGRRAEKRNSKIPIKSKFDPFSLKPGSLSSNAAAGGSSILGLYGLKSDLHDVTKHEDELPLDALLDGSYACPNLGKDRGRKNENLNENVLQSVREALSILQLQRPSQSHNFLETDNSFGQKPTTCQSSPEPFSVASDKGDSYDADILDKVEDSCSKPTPEKPNFPLYKPKDVSEHLALPPPNDLQSLLLETTNLSVLSSRNTADLAYRSNLPPFPWSGHCKTISDAAKLYTSRSACQVRWMRIGNASTPVEGAGHGFPDLESLAYDHCLVPSGGHRSMTLEIPKARSISAGPAACSTTLQALPGAHSAYAEHCPKAAAAAQTLCEIAKAHPPLKLKKPLQRDVGSHGPRLNEGPEGTFQPSDLAEGSKRTTPSKKPRLSTGEKSKDLGFARTFMKGPMSWSTPKSTRSSPVKSANESERKPFVANAKPSPARVSGKACNGAQKLRKLMPADWSRGRAKLD